MRGLHEHESNIVPKIAEAAKLLEEIEMSGDIPIDDGNAKQIVAGGCLKDGDDLIPKMEIPPVGQDRKGPLEYPPIPASGTGKSDISRPVFPVDYDDIHNEAWREYTYSNGMKVRINAPTYLHVSKSGGHRVCDLRGHGHYMPKGWVHLEWAPVSGLSHCMEF